MPAEEREKIVALLDKVQRGHASPMSWLEYNIIIPCVLILAAWATDTNPVTTGPAGADHIILKGAFPNIFSGTDHGLGTVGFP